MKVVAAVIALFVTIGSPVAEAEQKSKCDVVVLIGDSLVSTDPTMYLAAIGRYTPAKKAFLIAGPGQAIMFPSTVEGTTFGWLVKGKYVDHAASVVVPTHYSGLESVALARRAYPNDSLCWIIALGSNDAGHLPEAWWDTAIGQMVDAIGDDDSVWVDVLSNSVPAVKGYTPEVSSAWNHHIGEATHWIQDRVCGWSEWLNDPSSINFRSVDRNALFTEGGVHLTTNGQVARSGVIAICASRMYWP